MHQIPDLRQSTEHNCGETVITTVFRKFGVPYDAPSLATEADGLHPATLETVLHKAGLKIQSGTMTLADLRHHTKQGRLVLCPISVYGGHWVIVGGVLRRTVHFQCPVNGPSTRGATAWAKIWTDITRIGHTFDSWGIAVWKS